jgi:alcohol-forming fatty acyl-CoA reductase
VLAEAYRGRSILLTGGTGFLGTALVEKILRSLPELGRLYLLIRASRDRSAASRFKRDVLGSAAFSGLRRELGDAFEDRVSETVRVLEGDVHAHSLGLGEEKLLELSREVDVVIHSAASVVFDAPLDAAVESNVHGTLGLLRLARGWEKKPLFLHVSTAYVAGMSEGFAPEEPPGDASPNGTPLDPYEEVSNLEGVVREVDPAHRGDRLPGDGARREDPAQPPRIRPPVPPDPGLPRQERRFPLRKGRPRICRLQEAARGTGRGFRRLRCE